MTINYATRGEDYKTFTISFAVLPKSEISLEFSALQYAQSLLLIAFIDFSIIRRVQLMHGNALKGLYEG